MFAFFLPPHSHLFTFRGWSLAWSYVLYGDCICSSFSPGAGKSCTHASKYRHLKKILATTEMFLLMCLICPLLFISNLWKLYVAAFLFLHCFITLVICISAFHIQFPSFFALFDYFSIFSYHVLIQGCKTLCLTTLKIGCITKVAW